ncbi:hypothetical protein IWX75_002609 [Arthrobacter sp. CAN_A6]
MGRDDARIAEPGAVVVAILLDSLILHFEELIRHQIMKTYVGTCAEVHPAAPGGLRRGHDSPSFLARPELDYP